MSTFLLVYFEIQLGLSVAELKIVAAGFAAETFAGESAVGVVAGVVVCFPAGTVAARRIAAAVAYGIVAVVALD